MFRRRSENMANLKSTTTYSDSNAIRQAIAEALEKDLASIKTGMEGGTTYYMMYVKEVQNVKADIFKEYLLLTNDFETSVYGEKSADSGNDTPPSTPPADDVTPPADDPADDSGDTGKTEPDVNEPDIKEPAPTPAPKKNDIIKDKKSGVTYKVTSAKKSSRSVAYYKPKNKKVKTTTIPDTVTINGYKYKVTSIAKNAFKGCTKLKKVTIGKNVTSIGVKAFYGCKKLKTITIKTKKLKLSKVGKHAFKGIYSKAKVYVPKSKAKSYKTILKKRGAGKKFILKKK